MDTDENHKTDAQEEDENPTLIYGELTYTRQELASMGDYYSNNDDRSLNTPGFFWRISEGIVRLTYYSHKDTPDEFIGDMDCDLPKGIESSREDFDEGKFQYVMIPVSAIQLLQFHSKKLYNEDYEVPQAYSIRVKLLSGETMELRSTYEEDMTDMVWYYLHELKVG